MSNISELAGQKSDESSSYESYSSGDDGTSSDEEAVMLKPVFLSRSQRDKDSKKNDKHDRNEELSLSSKERKRDIALHKAEIAMEQKHVIPEIEFDGVDDTDDLEPEKEYHEWRLREEIRHRRDREVLKKEEIEREERIKRENMTEDQLIEDFEKRKAEKDEDTSDKDSPFRKGVFFNE